MYQEVRVNTEFSIEESTLAFARDLIQRESVTPQDRAASNLSATLLGPFGFRMRILRLRGSVQPLGKARKS